MIGDCYVPTNNPILGKQEESKGFKREFSDSLWRGSI